MRRAVTLLSLCLALAMSFAAPAQTAPAPGLTTLKIATRVVAVPVIVHDKAGAAVRNLGPMSFEVREDGKPQPLRYLSEDAELPLTLVLLVDTSGSQRTLITAEEMAARVFFRTMLTRDTDRAALVQFDDNILTLQPFTPDWELLDDRLDGLMDPHPSLPGMAGNRGGTLLYDSVCQVADTMLAGIPGRKAMVLLTDGEDNGSRNSMDQAVACAQKADATVFSVLYSMRLQFGLRTMATGISGQQILENISAQTGGGAYVVTTQKPLRTVFEEIAEDLRDQYQLGFTLPPAEPAGYHKLQVKVREKGLTVEARRGYFAPAH